MVVDVGDPVKAFIARGRVDAADSGVCLECEDYTRERDLGFQRLLGSGTKRLYIRLTAICHVPCIGRCQSFDWNPPKFLA